MQNIGKVELSAFIVAVTLLLTIATALGLGIVLGYWLISGILHIMGHRPEVKPAAVAVEAHSGD